MIKTLLFILFFLVIALGIVILVINQSKSAPRKKGTVDLTNDGIKRKKLNKVGGGLIGAGLICAILIPGSFHQVEAGHAAVVKSLGKVVGTRTPGTYFDFYMFNEYTFFDTTVQKLDIETVSYSSDAQTMDIAMTIQYKIDPGKVENILTEYTNMASLEQRIEKVADDKVKAILSKYTAMEIIETRAAISPEVENAIRESVDDHYYVAVTAVNLTNIDFTDEFEQSVENKVIAEQQKEAAITKAEQELEVAKLTAQAKIEASRGDAESQKIIASASAEAMALKIIEIASSLGYEIEETYFESVETVVLNTETNDIVSSTIVENEVTTKPIESVVISEDNETKLRTTVTKKLVSTNYSIKYDTTHTQEDIAKIIDFVEYIEYLEKWDGKLPSVTTGNGTTDIIVPSTGV